MSAPQRLTIVVVDDDHDYKVTLATHLAEFDVRFWGCRPKKCDICNADQPFADAVDFIRGVNANPDTRLVGIVLDANEFANDENSIKHILPALQNDARLNTVPVIVYSVRHLPGQDLRAKRAGATFFFDRTKANPRQAADLIRMYALP